MKKKQYLLGGLGILMFMSLNLYLVSGNELKSSHLSLSVLASNLNAYAQDTEAGILGCGGNVTFVKDKTLKYRICPNGGTHLTCRNESNVCCDPSKQTDCKGILGK